MSFRVPGVPEDTSRSGACVRLKRPLAVGSRITIKWHREQFPAIARNCRKDGGDFLLGVWREAEIASATKSASHSATIDAKAERMVENPAGDTRTIAAPVQKASPAPVRGAEAAPVAVKTTQAPSPGQSRQPFQNAVARLPRGRAQKLRFRAHPLVPKGQLCNRKQSFHIFGVVSRTKTRPQNPRSRGSSEQAEHARTDAKRPARRVAEL